jgi:apoptosis-inducing factor 3
MKHSDAIIVSLAKRDGGIISDHANGEEMVLGRRGDEFFAIGAHCTHCDGPLEES